LCARQDLNFDSVNVANLVAPPTQIVAQDNDVMKPQGFVQTNWLRAVLISNASMFRDKNVSTSVVGNSVDTQTKEMC